MTKPGRRPLFILAGAAILGVVLVIASQVSSPHRRGHIAMPADNASPEEVVSAYLAALDAHDCATAKTLASGDTHAQAKRWCEGVARLDNISVGQSVQEDPAFSGHAASWEVAYVPVGFDLDWRFLHGDPSMPEGPTDWGYLVGRASTADPWRIFDEGDG